MITTIATTTLAVLAAPTPDPRGPNNGITIPLTKRTLSPNGKKNINSDAFKSHVASHSAKIIGGMKIFESHAGAPHPSALKRDRSPQINGAGVDLTKNEEWYGTIWIGTPAKSFTVQFDTGSSDLFVPASTGNENCRSHLNLWDPASSPGAKDLNLYFGMTYADGATVIGKEYTDNVTVAGFTADIQTIGAATIYSSQMEVSEFPADGVLGLAFPSLSVYHASPLFHTLFSEGKLPQPMFSLELTPSGGELYIGGVNEALYIDGTLTFTPLTNLGLWELKIDNIKVNDKIVLEDVLAIVDTGSNFIFGDTSRVSTLHQAYGGGYFGDGYYTFPCNSFPSVTFTISGKPLIIPGEVLLQGRVAPGSGDCFSGIMTFETDPDHWSIGTIFLQQFYTVFDFNTASPRVGFAKLSTWSPPI